jgi:Fe-S-cluster containining protein
LIDRWQPGTRPAAFVSDAAIVFRICPREDCPMAGSNKPVAEKLIAAFDANPAYADDARFPRRVKRDEGADVAELVYAELDDAAADRARAAQADGTPLACDEGCNYCCEELIMSTVAEEAAVTRWLQLDDHHDVRDAFLAAYPEWKQRIGDMPDQLAEHTARGDVRGHQELYLDHYAKRIMCPFNREGLCTIYPVRPIGCRSAHAIGTADRCRADHPTGAPPDRFAFVPLDRLITRSRDLVLATHRAMRAPGNRPVCLGVSVYERLAGKAAVAPKKVGRNEPCPCGSGAKYKRCCGK